MGSARRLRLWALALALLGLSKQRLFSLLEVKEVRGTHDEQHGSTEPSGVEVNIMDTRR